MASPTLVDVHMHIFPTKEAGDRLKESYEIWEYGPKPDVRFSRYRGDVDDVVRAMAEAGYARAVAVNLFAAALAREEAIAELPAELRGRDRERAIADIDAAMPEKLRAFNRWACDLARARPEIVPYVAADPWALPGEAGARHLRELAERHGARGIKLHPVVQRFAPADPRMGPVYRTCVELGLTVLAHSGTARGVEQYAEPAAFAPLVREFPDLRLVLAHLGGGSWRQTRDLARAFPQVAFDCCEILEWTGAPAAPTDADLARLIQEIGPGRVMMGTDFPWYDLDHTVERVMALPLLGREEKEAILGANAFRILGL